MKRADHSFICVSTSTATLSPCATVCAIGSATKLNLTYLSYCFI